MDAQTPRHEDDLSDFERHLAGWQPASDGLDADAMLFAAGTSGRPARAEPTALAGVVCAPDRAGRGAGRVGPVGARRAPGPGQPSSRPRPDTQRLPGDPLSLFESPRTSRRRVTT